MCHDCLLAANACKAIDLFVVHVMAQHSIILCFQLYTPATLGSPAAATSATHVLMMQYNITNS
jgi:hypothetical protein